MHIVWAFGFLSMGVGLGARLFGRGVRDAGQGTAMAADGVGRSAFLIGAATLAVMSLRD